MGAWISSHDKICGHAPHHRSVRSSQPTFIIFHNVSCEYVRVYWIDYGGMKRIYSILKPGAIHYQSTFETHAWTFDILTDKLASDEEVPAIKLGTLASDFRSTNLIDMVTQQQVVYPRSGPVARRVTILDSPPVPWCIYSHLEFFNEYKDTVREVMMAYSRLSKLRGSSQKGNLGDLPMCLLMRILANASPEVFCMPTKPPLPDGATPADYSYKELLLLFEGTTL